MLFGPKVDPEVVIPWFGRYFKLASKLGALPWGLKEKYSTAYMSSSFVFMVVGIRNSCIIAIYLTWTLPYVYVTRLLNVATCMSNENH